MENSIFNKATFVHLENLKAIKCQLKHQIEHQMKENEQNLNQTQTQTRDDIVEEANGGDNNDRKTKMVEVADHLHAQRIINDSKRMINESKRMISESKRTNQ